MICVGWFLQNHLHCYTKQTCRQVLIARRVSRNLWRVTWNQTKIWLLSLIFSWVSIMRKLGPGLPNWRQLSVLSCSHLVKCVCLYRRVSQTTTKSCNKKGSCAKGKESIQWRSPSELLCDRWVIPFAAMPKGTNIIVTLDWSSSCTFAVNQYRYVGITLDTEHWDDKGIQRQLRYQHRAANKLRASFSRCWNAVKNVLFVPFVRPCMHHNYGVISGSHACRDCVWPIIFHAVLYTTCPGERVLIVTRFRKIQKI